VALTVPCWSLDGLFISLMVQVTWLECRQLRLLADYEVAAVTADDKAEQAAIRALQEAQQKLSTVDAELAETQQLLEEQQAALAALRAEEKASDRGLKREFAEADALDMPKLSSLFKARLAPAASFSVLSSNHGGSSTSGAAVSLAAGPAALTSQRDLVAPGSAALEFVPLGAASGGRGSATAAAALIARAAGGGAAAAAAAANVTSDGAAPQKMELRGPLGPAALQLVPLTDSQRPEGLDVGMWERFVQYRAARARLELAVRQQMAQVRMWHVGGRLMLVQFISCKHAQSSADVANLQSSAVCAGLTLAMHQPSGITLLLTCCCQVITCRCQHQPA
jgi:hypothetical protein